MSSMTLNPDETLTILCEAEFAAPAEANQCPLLQIIPILILRYYAPQGHQDRRACLFVRLGGVRPVLDLDRAVAGSLSRFRIVLDSLIEPNRGSRDPSTDLVSFQSQLETKFVQC